MDEWTESTGQEIIPYTAPSSLNSEVLTNEGAHNNWQTVIGCVTKRLQKLCMQRSVSGGHAHCVQVCFLPSQSSTCTNVNMDAYLIKLRVESLFYDRRFVLGFLMNVWLEVPETEDWDTITLLFTGLVLKGIL